MVQVGSDRSGAPDVDFVALPAGTKIGRYEVLAVLGQGGFGITYHARDAQLGREVAVKEYLPTSLAIRQRGSTVSPRSTRVVDDFTRGRDRFVAEGRTLATLHRAPGIVRVFDFLELNDTAYIVMELIRGDTLDKRLKSVGRLDPPAVGRILWTLLDGLEQVHAAGFLHRDIKPSNIMLDEQGNPTLIDFGAARAAMTGRMATMTAVFTPGYAAAEQMSSAEQGPWTDIYGLAATLYHAIAGKAPPSAIDRMLDDQYEPLTRLADPEFSRGLLAGLDAALAVRASDRPQSIGSWRTLISAFDPEATIAMRPRVSALAPSALSPSPAPRRIGLYAGGAVAALLLVAGGTYLTLTSRPPSPQALSLQDMRTEDLERLLAERRAADAAAAEKRRLEEEARRKADVDSAAKRQADADLAKAQQQLQSAEQELVRLRGEIEASRQQMQSGAESAAKRVEAEAAQRRAEAEIAALKDAELVARQKAAAEAEAKHRADEALARAQAERQRAEAEALRKAEEARAHGAVAAAIAAFDGAYGGTYDQMGARPGDHGPRQVSLQISSGVGSGSLQNTICGNSPISIRVTPAGDVSGEATTFDAACQKLPLTVKGKLDGGRLLIQLAGVGVGGGASLALVGSSSVGRIAAKPAPSIVAAPPAPPVDTARWVGRIKCATWPGNGLPLDLSATGGQVTSGPRGSAAFSMAISGTRYSASVKWTVPDPIRSFSGTFFGTIAGDRISATTIARSDFKSMPGPPDDQCTLDLSKVR